MSSEIQNNYQNNYNNYQIQANASVNFANHCTDISQLERMRNFAKKIADKSARDPALVQIHNIIETQKFDGQLQFIEAKQDPFEQMDLIVNLATEANTDQIEKVVDLAKKILMPHQNVLKERCITTFHLLANYSQQKGNFTALNKALSTLRPVNPNQSVPITNFGASQYDYYPYPYQQNVVVPQVPQQQPIQNINFPYYQPNVPQQDLDDSTKKKVEDFIGVPYDPRNSEHVKLKNDYLENLKQEKLLENKCKALKTYSDKYIQERKTSFALVMAEDEGYQFEEATAHIEEYIKNIVSEKDFIDYMKEPHINYPIYYEGGFITKETLEKDIKEYVEKVKLFK